MENRDLMKKEVDIFLKRAKRLGFFCNVIALDGSSNYIYNELQHKPNRRSIKSFCEHMSAIMVVAQDYSEESPKAKFLLDELIRAIQNGEDL